MKNIIILGVARSGKSTLARMIKMKYPNYNIIDGDCIRNAFEKIIPEVNINHVNGSGMEEKFSKFCLKLFENQIKEQNHYFNYIFESCDINPIQIKEYFDIPNTIIFFLGYPGLTVEETVNNYKKYAEEGDYMLKKSEDEIISRAIKWTNKSKELMELCSELNMKFVDVSYNRDIVFKKIIEELVVNE